ncbi:DEAD/DEAH box helicase [Clostridium sp. DSM 8431]|uniref:DEAD/DEAH box helicase n=1 Tax=Clostridium sp. DSM 8431 TaxID=1761781 RepID=UPI000B7CADF9|nr:DEAD/DEAH box helicase [Clostridium sp. DSM 8431]
MIKHALMEGYNKSTRGNNLRKGERILNNELISDIEQTLNGDKIEILSSVISENLFNLYSCKIDIDKSLKEVLYSSCSCLDFEKNNARSKKPYACKHISATFLKFLQNLEEDPGLKEALKLDEGKKELVKATEKSILDFLLSSEESYKDELKFEVILNKISWTGKISAEFKIGLKGKRSNRLYSLKDIDSFLVAYYNKIPVKYGKEFTFDIKTQKLSSEDKELIKFIELLKDIDLSGSSFKRVEQKLVSGKSITIPKALLREFLHIVKNHRIYLGDGFYSRQIETEVIEKNIPIPFNLKEIGEMMKLEAPNGIPEFLGECDNVFLYDTIIYIPPQSQVEKITPYIEAFNHSNSIFFTKAEEERVLRKLIPSIQRVSDDLIISNSISNKIVSAPVSFKFYFDKDDEIYLKLMVCYDKYEFNYFDDFNEKIIYRDSIKENEVIELLRTLGFEAVKKNFMFFKSEEYIFEFFKSDVLKLQEIGEVFYSDNFTGIKSLNSSSFKGEVRAGKYDYFDFKFKISDLSPEETYDILTAFRDNRKYYRLKNGEFLDLEEIELKKFLKLLDSLEEGSEINNNTIEINKAKGVYLEDYLEEEDIKYVKGRRGLKSLKNSLVKLKHKDFPLPEINAKLRSYQKDGYVWLKTLDFLGFGGILGDEMGLGKTLQTITFLASNKGKKAIIIAPTSLVYNWKSEFLKFAPNVKTAVLNGTPTEREYIINNYEEYDVLITTYNLLKRDMNLYENIEFDYCIIDEAQNIKNANSQNAKMCKAIKASRKFALTGTPLENSLMELWSIFDFIMPGYLYDEKKFTTRYHRRLNEDEVIIKEVTRMIKPFIMRRYKKDVILELPDKIEKKLIVPMTEEQKEVYGTYAKYAKDLIEKKVQDNEFKKSKIEILAFITKLRQICIDPSVTMENYAGGSGKIEALLDLVSQSISEGHKILVFSQFTSVLKNIAKEFKMNDITYSYLDGQTPSKLRGKLVEDFNNDENTSVFLISLKAGGTGLNLTSADVVIHFDPWWNPAVEDQATDRAHRIGQKNVVEVIKMISEGTIEERIVDLQEEKKELIEKVVGEGVELDTKFDTFSDKDILSLFNKNL